MIGGSLGDRFGRRRVFVVGVVAFALASAACALAPTAGALVAARLLQGIGGALMTPGSLAMIQASLRQADRARAIGLWSGLSGVAAAVGPFLGGLLIAVDWRLIFWINVPLAIVAAFLALRCAPESRDEQSSGSLDLPGAATGALALGASTYALVSAPGQGVSPAVVGSAVLAVVAAVAFVFRERSTAHPMVPPNLFADRVFTVANLLTLCVYAALGGLFFLLVLQLQVTLGWTPLEAGLATMPMTVLLTLFSGQAGALAQRTGPRLPLTVGPAVAAAGAALLAFVGPGDAYVTGVLPGVLLFGVGLVTIVAPLTAAVMAAAPPSRVGVASGVNNAVARSAGLIAVAALPVLVGLGGQAWSDPVALTQGYRDAALLCAALLAAGSLVALVGLRPQMRVLSPGHHAGLTVPHHDPCP